MNNRKKFEDTVKDDLDVRASIPTYDRLRDAVLNARGPARTTASAATLTFTRRMRMRISTAKIVIATLIGAGIVTAAAVGVSIQKYRVEKRPGGGYLVGSEETHTVMSIPGKAAASEEEAVGFAEEIARLKQAGQRELVGAMEVEVNGQLDGRTLAYNYTLADGQTSRVGERDFEVGASSTLVGERQAEAGRLFKQALTSGQEPAIFERVIQGRTFTFQKYTFTLSDGTAVAWSMGKLKKDQ
jgi:hypothetical protein